MVSKEIEAMGAIETALGSIEDVNVQQRVLRWALDRFNIPKTLSNPTIHTAETDEKLQTPQIPPTTSNEIQGIAILGEDGEINFTIRDIKARSANDAGVRLALVATYAHEKLTGNEVLNRTKVLTPLLEDWRINTGSIRAAIIKHRGIISVDRHKLRLDFHAKVEAEQIIDEILDDQFKGRWSPSKVGKRKKLIKQ